MFMVCMVCALLWKQQRRTVTRWGTSMPTSDAPDFQLEPDDSDVKNPDWAERRRRIKSLGPFIMGGPYNALTGKNQSMLVDGQCVDDEDLSSMTMTFAVCGLETQRFLTPVSIIPKEAGAGVALQRVECSDGSRHGPFARSIRPHQKQFLVLLGDPLRSLGRSVARSLGRSVARSLGRSVARSFGIGRSVASLHLQASGHRRHLCCWLVCCTKHVWKG